MLEAHEVAKYLKSLEPGLLPFEIFHAAAGITVTPIYEVVPVRMTPGGEVEIFLLQRDANDPVWAGLLHTPGTVIRANDDPGVFTSAQQRILKEVGVTTFASGPVFVETRFHQVKRGRELALIHWATFSEEPRHGSWVSARALPSTIVDSQVEFIRTAVDHFQLHEKSTKKS